MANANNIKLKKNNVGKLAKKIPYPIRKLINNLKVKFKNLTTKSDFSINTQNLYWYNRVTNFGDLVGPYLFEKITGEKPVFKTPDNNSSDTTILSAGSILNLTKRDTIIWGSGIMSKDVFFVKPFKTLAVRGPYTRRKILELGYDCPETYGDPALLIPRYYNPEVTKKYKIGILPHHTDLEKVKRLYGNNPVIKIIEVTREVEPVLDDIISCEYLLSSSLHGVIFGNAYKVPTAWVQFSHDLPGDDIKFYDYFGSIKLDIKQAYPLFEDKAQETDQLTQIVREFPQPNHPLIDEEKLLAACPFGKDKL